MDSLEKNEKRPSSMVSGSLEIEARQSKRNMSQ